MAIKVRKKTNKTSQSTYKSSKQLITSKDIEEADRLDAELQKRVNRLEKILDQANLISVNGKKQNALKVWYEVGKTLNGFLKKFAVNNEDEKEFWNNLYYIFPKIHHGVPTSKISKTRNDFIISTKLAKHPWSTIKRIKKWAIWREVLAYKNIAEDDRILKWVVDELAKNPGTKNEARVLLKVVAQRFKKIYTNVLSDKELRKKLQEIKNVSKNNKILIQKK